MTQPSSSSHKPLNSTSMMQSPEATQKSIHPLYPSPVFSGVLLLSFVALVGSGGYMVGRKSVFCESPIIALPSPLVAHSLPMAAVSPEISPGSSVAIPDKPANWKTYHGDEFSFKYPEGWQIYEDINTSIPLTADQEIEVGLPGSDQFVLRLYIYNSSLTAHKWWEQEGTGRFSQLVQGYAEIVHPKPSSVSQPVFTQTSRTIAGRSALVAEGFVNAGQYGGGLLITVLDYSGEVYMFVVNKNLYEDGRTVTISNQIFSSLQFLK